MKKMFLTNRDRLQHILDAIVTIERFSEGMDREAFLTDERTISAVVYAGAVRYFNPERDYLFPIPSQEVILNPNLTQNQGF